MKVIALVLTDQGNRIGKNHIVLNYLPAYIRYFEKLTQDAPIIMGRLTFEAIAHTLKNKRKLVVTRSEKYHSSRAKTYPSFQAALDACKRERKVFVIGGSEIFKQAWPYTKQIMRTCVKARFRADDYFPDIDTSEFELVSAKCINADLKNRFDYCIEKWTRTTPEKEIA